MNIITLTDSHLHFSSGKKVLTHAEYQHFHKSNRVIHVAKKRAGEIVEEARVNFEKEKQRGFDEGMMESKIEQSEQMLKMVDRTINYLSEVEDTMANILMSAVKKIIEDFDDKQLVTGLIKAALQHVRNEQQVTVRIPPSQFTYVKDQIAAILSEYKGIGFINPVSDPRMTQGHCIIESKIGVIDASIDVQMEALKRRFARLSAETMGNITKSAESAGEDVPEI